MPAAPLSGKARGFSLPEVLCALALFIILLTTLSGYYQALQQGATAQWQTRQLWRYLREYTESESPAAPPGWQVKQQQTSVGGCVSIEVTLSGPAGKSGRLTRLHCPPPAHYQES